MKSILSALLHIIYLILFFLILYSLYSLSNYFQKQNERIEKITAELERLDKDINLLSQNLSDYNTIILHELEKTRESSNKQFSETKEMKDGYDQLLDEQKKLRIDTVKKDSAVSNMIVSADQLYKEKNYREAYKKFSDILQYQPENIDARFKKLDCLFSINPMDSTKYNEILSECDFLMKNGYSNPRLDEIKKHIEAERGAR